VIGFTRSQLALLGAFTIVVVSATTIAARTHWHDPDMYLDRRTAIISEQIAQLTVSEEPFAVVLGNSLVERGQTSEICGLTAVNGGIGRARVGDLMDLAEIARVGHPEIRVLSVGVNDSTAGVSLDEFSKKYADLVSVFEPTHVIGITGDRRDQFNAMIQDVASRATYIEPLEAEWLQGDGVHYTIEGFAEWNRRLSEACAVN